MTLEMSLAARVAAHPEPFVWRLFIFDDEMFVSGYGKCVHCGEALPEKRLDAVPWARHCVRCQDLQERGLLGDDEE